MNSSASSDYQKFAPSAAPAPPPSYGGDTKTGIPISSDGSYMLPTQFKPTARVPWSTGLCDCFSDPTNCCITLCCPCITFGQVAEIVDKGSNPCGVSGALYALLECVTGCACLYSCFYRSKLREQFALTESPCGDCLVHCFCECCALCQEYRELKGRGFDMSIGWQGNMERQNHGITMAPIVQGGMTR
ncbi:unnamed protein product [Cuscuta europaea]|uniref:Uncharacterized protein n=1 Tax=Cuscuta europaea TaxID=41803 RepID=A0A9P1E2D2_CUSEU|nr:unnamed protein product [Cuscuta europaea]